MSKKVLGVVLALSLAFIVFSACFAPAFASVTYYDHVSAVGSAVIDIGRHQPRFQIYAAHLDRGAHAVADYLEVDLWTDIGLPIGPVWLPFAIVTNGPSLFAFNKNFIYVGLDTANVVQLVKNCELLVYRIGKIVIVYWTVPLVTPAITVPPGGLVLNGYGSAQTAQLAIPLPNGVTLTIDDKAEYAAHATFVCPAWKFCGSVGDQNTMIGMDDDWRATK